MLLSESYGCTMDVSLSLDTFAVILRFHCYCKTYDKILIQFKSYVSDIACAVLPRRCPARWSFINTIQYYLTILIEL